MSPDTTLRGLDKIDARILRALQADGRRLRLLAEDTRGRHDGVREMRTCAVMEEVKNTTLLTI